jgi:hypothetical protein
VPPVLDSALLARWARAAVTALERHRAEIDRINVFPVPDSDTGTNLLLTMRAAVDAAGRDGDAAALARGALVGARGNSGVVLSQVLRGLADAVAAAVAAKAGPSRGGAVLADALRRAHRLATAAMVRPREGTVLTVLSAAAAAAAAAGSDRLDVVAVAAADAAREALRATTAQLPELARAGVVDAGGMGIHVVLDALAALVSGRPPTGPLPRGARGGGPAVRRGAAPGAFDYEVMYLLDTAPGEAGDTAVAALRGELDALGDSVAVVGDGTGTWNVHVHCTDVGAAIEAGVVAGRPHGITVERFADPPGPGRFPRARAVVLVTGAAGPAGLARAAGADVLDPARADEAGLAAALVATGARHVVLLPCAAGLTPVAEAAASAARRDGQEVLVVPTASVLQGLAALAVHDPARRPDEDGVAMAEAAAGTRTGALLVAETEALTWAGRCEPGDVLGLVDGEVVLIAPDVTVGALWLAHRMLTAGGEIVTALLGEGADDALGEGLAADLRRTHPEVETAVLRGGEGAHPLVLGVE